MELYDTYTPAEMKRMVGKYIKNRDDVDDMVQDIYLELLSNKEEVKNPPAYVYSVIRTRCLNFIRNKSTRNDNTFDAGDVSWVADNRDQIREVEDKMDMEILNNKVKHIHPKAADIISMRSKMRMYFVDIANELNKEGDGETYTADSVRYIFNKCIDNWVDDK